MRRIFLSSLFILIMTVAPSVFCQDSDASRNRTRESLAALLEKAGPEINVTFRQSTKQPFNYVGELTQGLVNSESFEIVISVTPNETIGFRIYPHYKGGYINVDRVNDRPALMRLLLRLSDRAFLFGARMNQAIFSPATPSRWNRVSRKRPSKLSCAASLIATSLLAKCVPCWTY